MNSEFKLRLEAQLASTASLKRKLNPQIDALSEALHPIKLKVELNTAEVKRNIKAQMAEVSKNLPKLKTEKSTKAIKATAKATKELAGYYKTVGGAIKAVNKEVSPLLKNWNKQEVVFRDTNTTVSKYTDNLGHTLTITERISDKQSRFKASLKATNQELSRHVTSTINANQSMNTYEQALSKIGVTTKYLNDNYKLSTKSIDSSGKSLEKWIDEAGNTITVTGKAVNGLNQFDASFKQVNKSTSDNRKNLSLWRQAVESVTQHLSIAMFIYQAIAAMKDMVRQVGVLDHSLVELQKVSSLTGAGLDNFTKKAFEAASKVAKTGSEMIDAATEFAKAGYDESQILLLGEIALRYTNIADEMVTAGDAASFIIAQMKAFNIEARDAEHIIDAVNEVANNFAVSSADIATNLGKSSAVLANANNSFEEMIGLLTAGTELTRDAGKVSNGLKTIALRLHGMEEDGSKSLVLVAKLEQLFQKLGLTLYDTDGTLKSTFDILHELSEIYPTLTAAEKAYTTELIAGKHRSNIAVAILKNFDVALKATETALNSEGSAMRENAKVLDSVAGHLAALKSEWQNFSQSIVNSNALKALYDLGTMLLKVATSGFGQFIIKTTLTVGALKLLSKGINLVKESGAKLIPVLGNLTASGKKFNLSLISTNTKLALVSMAITAAVQLWQQYKNAQAEAHAKALEVLSTFDNEAEALDSYTKSIAENVGILHDANSSTNDVIDARKNLKQIQDDLIKNYGIESNKIDLLNGDLQANLEYLKKIRKERAHLAAIETEKEYKKQSKKLGEGSQLKFQYGSKAGEYIGKKYGLDFESSIGDFGSVYGEVDLSYLKGSNQQILDALRDLSKDILHRKLELQAELDLTDKEMEDFVKFINTKLVNFESEYGEAAQYVSDYLDVEAIANGLDNFNSALKSIAENQDGVVTVQQVEELLSKFPGLADVFERQGKTAQDVAIQNNSLVASLGHLASVFKDDPEALEYLKWLGGDQLGESPEKIEDVDNAINSLGFSTQDFANALNNAKIAGDAILSAFVQYNNDIVTLSKSMDILTAAQEELNETGYITSETMLAIINNDLLDYLDVIDGKLHINTNALLDNAEGYKETARAMIKKAYADDVVALAENKLGDMSKGARQELDKVNNSLENGSKKGEECGKGLLKTAAGIDAVAAAEGKLDLDGRTQELEALQNYYRKIGTMLDSLGGYTPSNRGRKPVSHREVSHEKNEKEWWEKEYEQIKSQFNSSAITIEEYIRGLESLLGRLDTASDAWKKINDELQKERMAKVESDYKRGIISLDEYIAKLKELISTYKKGTEAWKELADKIKSGLEAKADTQRKDLEIAEKAALEIINQEIKKLQDLRKEKSDYYDKLIKDKEKANKETEKELELTKLQEALENAKTQKRKRVWHEGLGWQWEADTEAIRKAQEDLDKFKQNEELEQLKKEKEESLKVYDEQIKAWEEYKEAWTDVADNYQKQQDKITLSNQLGADAEQRILNDRLAILEEYKNKYIATMKEIENFNKQTAEDIVTEGKVETKPVQPSAPKKEPTVYVVKSGDTLSGISAKYNMNWRTLYDANRGVIGGNPSLIYPGQKLTIPGFNDGGMVDYTGLAMVHGSKSNPEWVLNNEQMKNLLRSYTNPTLKNNGNSSSTVNTYNFGNIELPNVHNANQFITELEALVRVTKHQ